MICILSFIIVFGQAGFIFDYKAHMIPHPDKIEKGGQDAFYASDQLLIVADGVGGWGQIGIDPSQFSRFLATKAGQLFKENPQHYKKNPRQLIALSHNQNIHLGSSTMVVATFNQNKLSSCYLGDSGYILFRVYGEQLVLIYQFTQQQHAFNFPYQLSMKNTKSDKAQDSICLGIQIKEGDIIVVGSDGLFDNLQVLTIKKLVIKSINDGTLLTFLPEKMAAMAIQNGKNTTFNSPFSQRGRLLGIERMGGKLDDTTVIIARVKPKLEEVGETINKKTKQQQL